MIIDCISDLHGHYPKLEGGDLLIVAGDLTARDEYKEYVEFNAWLLKQKYKKKILIAGNHDNWIQNSPMMKDTFYDCEYLSDSATEFEGLKIWGSSWTKTFKGMNPKCKAFTCDTEQELAEKWKLIPNDIDILVTHSPPYGVFDGIPLEDGTDFHAGSRALLRKVMDVSPFFHIFGHIHEGYGMAELGAEIYVNASHVNERYEPVNKPVRVIL